MACADSEYNILNVGVDLNLVLEDYYIRISHFVETFFFSFTSVHKMLLSSCESLYIIEFHSLDFINDSIL